MTGTLVVGTGKKQRRQQIMSAALVCADAGSCKAGDTRVILNYLHRYMEQLMTREAAAAAAPPGQNKSRGHQESIVENKSLSSLADKQLSKALLASNPPTALKQKQKRLIPASGPTSKNSKIASRRFAQERKKQQSSSK